VLLDHVDLDARLSRADLVITAEGALDHQTPRGKVPAEVARRAKVYGRPVPALAGTLGEGAQEVPGVDACHGILPAPMALAEALTRASELLTDATERALRMIVLGTRLPLVLPGEVSETEAHADVSGTQRPSSVR
jgi:glycerate kinase